MSEYICDDRNQLEVIHKVNSMTDDEFKKHIQKLKQNSESK